jgi:hypothetical protein
MAAIDTLKLARALRERGGFAEQAAEATAEAINEALGAQMASKADLDKAVGELKSDIRLLKWPVGVNSALSIAILIKLFVH